MARYMVILHTGSDIGYWACAQGFSIFFVLSQHCLFLRLMILVTVQITASWTWQLQLHVGSEESYQIIFRLYLYLEVRHLFCTRSTDQRSSVITS